MPRETSSGRESRPLLAGLAGALALNLLHEGVRQLRDDAPRMDAVAKRGIRRAGRAMGLGAPRGGTLYTTALVGDVVSNALYYAAAVALGTRRGARGRWLAAAASGLAAGVGAVVLPQRIGLGHAPHDRLRTTRVMTVAWYLIGALVAAATAAAFASRARRMAARHGGVANADITPRYA